LNSSSDGNPLHLDQVVFLGGRSLERAEAVSDLDAVIGLLWRDGRISEWIEVAVIGDGSSAIMGNHD